MMKQLLALLLTFAIAVLIGYQILKPAPSLPILEPRDINPALIDADLRHRATHKILPFTLVNHLGDTVHLDDVAGKILVVDFFFTRCPTICPIMTENLTLVQKAISDRDDVMILSHSVTPVADSVSVLARYAERYDVNPERWWMLTGEKKEIYRLARQSYFTCLDEGDGGLQDFIHTENVALVDGLGRLRGFYDGTDQTAVNQLIQDLALLPEK
jgi:protein SCO1/2